MLLKVVLFAYSQGIVRSRAIERVCQEYVTFMALCGMTAPHFTTIAQFVRTRRDHIAQVFAAVRAACDGQGLIGRDMFAIDGVQLPSNASTHPTDRCGPTDGLRTSTRTDNENARMATSKGVLQRCTGVAAVNSAHQIIDEAQGTGSEQELLVPVVVAVDALRTPTTLIADNDMRRRDERFATQDRYTALPDPLYDKSSPSATTASAGGPSDVTYDADARTCTCPAGKCLYRK